MTENTHAGRLIVLTGPTAVGKGTVEAKLRADHPEVWVSVSATTRAPRPGRGWMASTIGSSLKTSSWPVRRPVSSWKLQWCTAWPIMAPC